MTYFYVGAFQIFTNALVCLNTSQLFLQAISQHINIGTYNFFIKQLTVYFCLLFILNLSRPV